MTAPPRTRSAAPVRPPQRGKHRLHHEMEDLLRPVVRRAEHPTMSQISAHFRRFRSSSVIAERELDSSSGAPVVAPAWGVAPGSRLRLSRRRPAALPAGAARFFGTDQLELRLRAARRAAARAAAGSSAGLAGGSKAFAASSSARPVKARRDRLLRLWSRSMRAISDSNWPLMSSVPSAALAALCRAISRARATDPDPARAAPGRG